MRIENDVSMEPVMEAPGTRPGDKLSKYVEENLDTLERAVGMQPGNENSKSSLQGERDVILGLLSLYKELKNDKSRRN